VSVLGVDLGTKHIGLALADGPLARPLTSLRHRSLSETAVRLAHLAQSHGVTTIVLGLPDGQLAAMAESLTDELKKRTDIFVVTHPETLSTKEALAKLRQAGAKRRKLRDEHSFAACLILEDYLEIVSRPDMI
jgi:putative transcription antitermination factor YqgF